MAPASVALVQWEIVNLDTGEYKIKTRGTYVGVMPDGHLWAFLREEDIVGAEWKIEAVPQHGDDTFMCVPALVPRCCPAASQTAVAARTS